MAIKRIWVVSLLVGVCSCFVMWLLSPIIYSVFQVYRFSRSAQVVLDIPKCRMKVPGSTTIQCCQCVVGFQGQQNPSGLAFAGPNLKSSYDAKNRTYIISGEGTVKGGKNTLELRDGRVFLNREEIAVRWAPIKILMTTDGDVLNEYGDWSW